MANDYQKDFTLDITGDVSGKAYAGVFTIKSRLSHMDRFRQDQVKRSILGGDNPNAAGPEAMSMAEAFSQIAIRVLNGPDWFKNSNAMDIADFNVIQEIYTRCIKIEQDEIDKVTKKAEEAKKTLDKPITTQD